MPARKKREDASSMASRQREIAVSEFFAKNRHLLGFDKPTKALLTAIREAVDNALDACEEAHIAPQVDVEIAEVRKADADPIESNKRKNAAAPQPYRVTITDNGPGILKSQLERIFGQLLYGSKFHRLKQSRGQQGIGISAAVMYGQMSTGHPAEITSKTGKGRPVNRIHLQIDTKKNRPKTVKDEVLTGNVFWNERASGTSISIILEGSYKGGKRGVDAYLRQTALANPHARITFTSPRGERTVYPQVVDELPADPKEILPHPHGVEIGTLLDMMRDAKSLSVSRFLHESFSRVSDKTAADLCGGAGLSSRMPSTKATRDQVERLYKTIQNTKLMAPPTNCLSPIGEEAIVKGLYWLYLQAQDDSKARKDEIAEQEEIAATAERKRRGGDDDGEQIGLFDADNRDPNPDAALAEGAPEVQAAETVSKLVLDEESAIASEDEGFFVSAVTRPPSVYRGNPFQVECGIFWGKGLPADELCSVFRFANRVPLQYQANACAMTKAVVSAPWRNYEVQQSKGAVPTGPLVIMVHIASAWVPYTSESKEAIAHYDEILKELRLAIMECGRKLQRFLRRRRREVDEAKKRSYINKYIDPIGEALQDILGLEDSERVEVVLQLRSILEESRDESGKKAAKKVTKKKATKKTTKTASETATATAIATKSQSPAPSEAS